MIITEVLQDLGVAFRLAGESPHVSPKYTRSPIMLNDTFVSFTVTNPTNYTATHPKLNNQLNNTSPICPPLAYSSHLKRRQASSRVIYAVLTKSSSVTAPVGHIVFASIPAKISYIIVSTITIIVTPLQTIRTRPDKSLQNKAMNKPSLGLTINPVKDNLLIPLGICSGVYSPPLARCPIPRPRPNFASSANFVGGITQKRKDANTF